MVRVTSNDVAFCVYLEFNIIFRKTSSHVECPLPISAHILSGALKNERSKQKTKCQKYFHNQKLRQKIRLKCENCTKGEYYFKQLVITGTYEQPFTYFSIQKGRGNDQKSNAGHGGGPKFPFCF